MRLELIIRAINQAIWWLHPPKLEEIIAVLDAKERGVPLDSSMYEQIQQERDERRKQARRGPVHVLEISGTIMQKGMGIMSSLGASTEELSKEFNSAMESTDVKRIVASFDTPGGSVYGVDEFASQIFAARGRKPMDAVVSPEAFSAGYYLASAFDRVFVQPTGMLGSVGVVATHIDISKALEEDGLKVSYITRGDYKIEGNSTEPLSKPARAEIQTHVDHYYDMFTQAVARHRGVSLETVEKDFGQGRIFNAEKAIANNMADGTATLEEVVHDAQQAITGIAATGRRRTALRQSALDLQKA